MEPNYVKEGVLKKRLIDKIYSIEQPPKFTQKDLPPDVEFKATTYFSSDDDEDPDKGGQKILSRKRREKKEVEEEKIPFSYSGKPRDDDYPDEGGQMILTKDNPLPDDEDDEHSFVPGKNSDDYRMEIALLESKKDKLMDDIETLEIELPKMERYKLELAGDLEKLQREIGLLEDIENSAKKDHEERNGK